MFDPVETGFDAIDPGIAALSRKRPACAIPFRGERETVAATALGSQPRVRLTCCERKLICVNGETDPVAPVVAFGQAIAYRLFSTKTYIAMPNTLTEEDKSRLESLCMLFGIGLALFDLNKDAPGFSIRMRAQRFYPDMFYVNEFAERLKLHDPELFEELFG